MLKNKLSLMLALMSVLVMVSAVVAEPTYDEQGDLIIPNSYKFIGKIDKLGLSSEPATSYIIIDDAKYLFDGDAIFRNIRGNKTVLANFEVGMQVEFYALKNIVTKMKEIRDTSDDKDEPKDIEPVQTDEVEGLRLENGVWVN